MSVHLGDWMYTDTRSTAITAFFVGPPLFFSAYALYRVAQFYGFTNDDDTE